MALVGPRQQVIGFVDWVLSWKIGREGQVEDSAAGVGLHPSRHKRIPALQAYILGDPMTTEVDGRRGTEDSVVGAAHIDRKQIIGVADETAVVLARKIASMDLVYY